MKGWDDVISSNDFRNGVTLELDGSVYQVIEFQHVKPGKGSPFVRTKLKNILNGGVVDRTFNAGERIPIARVDKREMQYLYMMDEDYTFMDSETFETFLVQVDAAEAEKIKPGTEVSYWETMGIRKIMLQN